MAEILTSRKVKSPLLPYQQEWINDEAPLKGAEKSRRIGWTYGEAYDATARRQETPRQRPFDYWFSSADESAAAEYIEYCRFWQKDMFGGIADYYTEQVEDELTRRLATAFCIRCPNGKRITAMSSNPRRFRSKGGDVGLDEYGFHDQAREMYRAAAPSAMRGGWIRFFSSHNGEESEFEGLCKQGRAILKHLHLDPAHPPTSVPYADIKRAARELGVMPIKLHRVTLLDAVAQGLVENINHFAGTKMTREEFVADCRARCIDEDMWNQEYMCIPSVGTSALLPYDLIAKCERDDLAAAVEGLIAPTGGPLFIGGDIGELHDPSVFWLLELAGDVLVTRGVRWFKAVPFYIQLTALFEWMRLPRFRRCCLDAGGIGAGLAQEAERVFGAARVEGVKFTLPVKEELAMPLRRAFEDVSIRIPSDGRIRESLHKVRMVRTASHNLRFDAPRDVQGHADEFWALALAHHAAGDAAGGALAGGDVKTGATGRWSRGDDDDRGDGWGRGGGLRGMRARM